MVDELVGGVVLEFFFFFLGLGKVWVGKIFNPSNLTPPILLIVIKKNFNLIYFRFESLFTSVSSICFGIWNIMIS